MSTLLLFTAKVGCVTHFIKVFIGRNALMSDKLLPVYILFDFSRVPTGANLEVSIIWEPRMAQYEYTINFAKS